MFEEQDIKDQIEALKWSLKLHLSEIMTDLPAGEVPFFQFVDEFSNEEQKEDLLNKLVQMWNHRERKD